MASGIKQTQPETLSSLSHHASGKKKTLHQKKECFLCTAILIPETKLIDICCTLTLTRLGKVQAKESCHRGRNSFLKRKRCKRGWSDGKKPSKCSFKPTRSAEIRVWTENSLDDIMYSSLITNTKKLKNVSASVWITLPLKLQKHVIPKNKGNTSAT